MSEGAMTADDIDAVMRLNPNLSAHGMISPDGYAAAWKCEMVDARRAIISWKEELRSSIGACSAASEWIQQLEPVRSAAVAISSYTLKHAAEEDRGTYIPNGAIIAAAIHHGFPIVSDGWMSPNVGIGISRLSLRRRSAAWRKQSGLPAPHERVEVQCGHRIVNGKVQYDIRPCTTEEAERIAGRELDGRRYLIVDGVVGCLVETAWLCPDCDGAAKSGARDCERCLCGDVNVKKLWQPLDSNGHLDKSRRVMLRPGQTKACAS